MSSELPIRLLSVCTFQFSFCLDASIHTDREYIMTDRVILPQQLTQQRTQQLTQLLTQQPTQQRTQPWTQLLIPQRPQRQILPQSPPMQGIVVSAETSRF